MSQHKRTHNGAVRLSFDATHGVATLTLDMPKVNIINEDFGEGLLEAIVWAEEHAHLKGIPAQPHTVIGVYRCVSVSVKWDTS